MSGRHVLCGGEGDAGRWVGKEGAAHAILGWVGDRQGGQPPPPFISSLQVVKSRAILLFSRLPSCILTLSAEFTPKKTKLGNSVLIIPAVRSVSVLVLDIAAFLGSRLLLALPPQRPGLLSQRKQKRQQRKCTRRRKRDPHCIAVQRPDCRFQRGWQLLQREQRPSQLLDELHAACQQSNTMRHDESRHRPLRLPPLPTSLGVLTTAHSARWPTSQSRRRWCP